MKIKIVFEDGDLLVIEKPAGVVVNKALTVKKVKVQDWAKDKFPISNFQFPISLDFVRRAGIVHRLDKETSGLLVIAKNAKAFANLQAQFKTRKTRKKYLALVHGEVKPQEGKIELPIARNPFNREKFGVFPGGRKAVTEYRTISNFQPRTTSGSGLPCTQRGAGQLPNFSFLEVFPKTGRTHQIRVHLKAIGHPIVADETYAGRKTNRADRKWCPRMFLHASFLGFFHPRTRKWMEFTSEFPPDLKKALQKFSV